MLFGHLIETANQETGFWFPLVFIAASAGHHLKFKKDFLVLLGIHIHKSPEGFGFPNERYKTCEL